MGGGGDLGSEGEEVVGDWADDGCLVGGDGAG